VVDSDHERIKQAQDQTHAAFRVVIGVLYGVILANKSQLCDFLVKAQSERFAEFSGEGNWQSELYTGLFSFGKSMNIDRIRVFCQTTSWIGDWNTIEMTYGMNYYISIAFR